MFGKNPPPTNHFDTLVSSKAEIVGDIYFSGGLHIDGKVYGNIIADDDSKAVVVLKKGARKDKDTQKSIHTFIKSRTSAYAKPREYEFVDALPKTKLGKVDYRELESQAKDENRPVEEIQDDPVPQEGEAPKQENETPKQE